MHWWNFVVFTLHKQSCGKVKFYTCCPSTWGRGRGSAFPLYPPWLYPLGLYPPPPTATPGAVAPPWTIPTPGSTKAGGTHPTGMLSCFGFDIVFVLYCQVTHFVITRPEMFHFRPGDYVFLNIPAIAKHEWHPFTISSCPENTSMHSKLIVFINCSKSLLLHSDL